MKQRPQVGEYSGEGIPGTPEPGEELPREALREDSLAFSLLDLLAGNPLRSA